MIRLVVGPGRHGPLRIVADGAVVNPGLPDEPLPQTLLAFAEALAGTLAGRGPQELELPRAELSWLVQADGDAIGMRWVRRGRPRSAVVRTVTLDRAELAEATRVALEGRPGTKRLLKALARVPAGAGSEPVPGFTLEPAEGALSLRVEVSRLPQGSGSPLHALLAPGRTELLAEGEVRAWSEEPPFLVLEDLARWAERAARPGRREPLPWPHGGTLEAEGDAIRLGRHRWPELRRPLISTVASTLEAFVAEVRQRLPALRRAPLLTELAGRARALHGPGRVKPLAPAPGAPKPRAPRKPKPAAPLHPGSVRKVTFEPVFSTRLPFAVEQIELAGESVLVHGDSQVAVLRASTGEVAWTREVRVARLDALLFAVDPHDRLWGLDLATGEPRWFRDSEGIVPLALHRGPEGVAILQEADALSGRAPLTGLGVWHFRAPLGEAVAAHIGPDRIEVVTGGGQLASLDPATGNPFFRVLAPRPFRHAPIRVGSGIVAILAGEGGDGLIHLDAATAELRWGGPLPLRDATPLVAIRGVAATVGRTGEGWGLALINVRTGKAQVVETGFRGTTAPALHAAESGFLLAGADGRAELHTPEGERLWAEEETAEATRIALPPISERRLVLVGSERPALYDLEARRRVARLPRREGLSAFAADASLRVVVADDGGVVEGFRLRGHLAVMPSPPSLAE